MAPACFVKNNRNWSRLELLGIIRNEVNSKFGLESFLAYKNDTLNLTIKDLVFPIALEDDGRNIVFYDSAELALLSENDKLSPYCVKNYLHAFYKGETSAYAYLYRYIMNYVAQAQNSLLYSQIVESSIPFKDPEPFSSFSNWLKSEEEAADKSYEGNLLALAFMKAFSPSIEQIVAHEREFFPELFTGVSK